MHNKPCNCMANALPRTSVEALANPIETYSWPTVTSQQAPNVVANQAIANKQHTNLAQFGCPNDGQLFATFHCLAI